MEYQFRPLTTWPTKPTTNRRRSPFRAGYADTIKLLEHELGTLRARNIVIQIALSERDIRRDGMPRADSRPWHPGVILSFDSKHGPLSYPCDTFDDWEANVRAIAMSLENLRAVDRYGVTKRGEQYQGWTALPAPPKADAGFATRADAAIFIAKIGGGVPHSIATDVTNRQEAFRRAALACHPDRGGDADTFKKLNAAKEMLDG